MSQTERAHGDEGPRPRRWQVVPNGTGFPVPDLFGPYRRTAYLAELARLRNARTAELAKHFGLDMIRTRGRIDRSGVVTRWPLRRDRGNGLTLNARHPLARELRALLLAIGAGRPPVAATDVTPLEAAHLANAPSPDVDLRYLFYNPLRTTILVTLEALGGRAELITLSQSAPGLFYHSVKTAVGKMIGGGVLERDGRVVRFVQQRWTAALRTLLRAYLRVDSEMRDRIASCSQAESVRQRTTDHYLLFGEKNVQRALVTLAQHGPMPYARVMALSKTAAERGIAIFERQGLILSRKSGRRRSLSLNAAHPVYAEFRALLRSLGSDDRVRAEPDLSAAADFRVDRLFSRDLRSSMLFILCANHGAMDGATMSLLLPQHDDGKIRRALRRLSETGVLVRNRSKNRWLYDFDEAYEHYVPLIALLRAVVRHWPVYRATAGVSRYLTSAERVSSRLARRSKRSQKR